MPTVKRRPWAAALTTTAALLLLPASGQAAQVFGSGFLHEPNQTDCALLGPCTVAAFVEIPSEGTVTEAGAPSDGVVTKFRVRAKVEAPNTQVTFLAANVKPNGPGQSATSAMASATASGPTVMLATTGAENIPIQEFAGRLPISKGQHLAISGPGNLFATYDSSGSKFSYEYAPPLVVGSGERASNEFLGELLVQGTLEPDADRDGFGDETQDACPSQASTQGACVAARLTITKFGVRKGKISYTLSVGSSVTFQLSKKVGHRFKPIGRAFSGPGKAGANHRSLPHAAKFAPGRYRLAITANGAADDRDTAKAVFRIKG
jgi:hypothetical protein